MKYRHSLFAASAVLAAELLDASPAHAITCARKATNFQQTGDSLYSAYVACRETIIAPGVSAYNMDTEDWDGGFGIDGSARCDANYPFARTINAIYALTNSTNNPITSGTNYGTDPLRFGGVYSRNSIDELDGRCFKNDDPSNTGIFATTYGSDVELYMGFFYDHSVVERASTILHEAVHAGPDISHEEGSTHHCLVPGNCDDHYPSLSPNTYQADFLAAYSARSVNGNSVMKDRARDMANFILDGKFNHPTNSRVLNFPDVPLLGDINGDKREDVCIFRSNGGLWFCMDGKELASGRRTEIVSAVGWGMPTDIPLIADVDGDSKGDLLVYRTRSDTNLDVATNGRWFAYSFAKSQVLIWNFEFGYSDSVPFTGKLDNDSKADLIVYEVTAGNWFSTSGGALVAGGRTELASIQYGGYGGDRPVVGDFDHDTFTDFGIYRAAGGGTWHAASTKKGIEVVSGLAFGENGDIPLVGDFDADGFVDDIGLYRPRNGQWHARTVFDSAVSLINGVSYGAIRDTPLVGRFSSDKRFDPVIYRPYEGTWHSLKTTTLGANFAGEPYGEPY
jgi:hypothetical protein